MGKVLEKVKDFLRIHDEDLKDTVVVITGASAGVGRATAWEFAKQGARIALIARGLEALEATQKEVEGLGAEARIFPMDVADPKELERTVAIIENEMGAIDIWVNNAMNSVFAPVKEMEPEEYKRVTEVTYLGYVYGTLEALKRMLPRNHGKIVFVGSALAYRGIPLQSAYCGAKHAIQGFFDSLRSELLHDKSNVKVTMVQLPGLNTTQFGWVKSKLPNNPEPLGMVFEPEVAAKSIVFAAKNDRREIYVGFPTVKAIVGDKIAPAFADKVLARQGYEGQQTDEPVDPNRKHNLWEPVPGPHSAYGPFHQRAKKSSIQLWIAMNRGLLGASALAGALGFGLAYALNKKNKREEIVQKELLQIAEVLNC